jgi:HAD superfamily hydrolase (TIGR01509 family)
MIQAIVFDFFDVIYTDALAAMLRRRSLSREGAIADASRRVDTGQISNDKFFELLADAFGESVADLHTEALSYSTLNQDLIPLIEHLSKEYRVGLLSNADKAFLRGLLHNHDLERLFYQVIISSEVGMAKPDPAIFRHILTKLDVKPQDSIFIDDNTTNVRVAIELGMHGIVYTGLVALRADLQEKGITLAGAS